METKNFYEKNKLIAKNTLLLYTRQIIVLIVGLFSVRIVLDVLGIEDYGIFSLIGGVVTLLSFLSNTMASATQRFFSFEIGKGNNLNLRKTFSVNLVIYLSIAIVAFITLETLGLWFLSNKLNIPFDKTEAVVFIFHCSVINFILTIFTAPLIAIIVAYEDMKYYAYISLIEVSLKLSSVILLIYISFDKLKLYGLLLTIVSLIIFLIYLFFCKRNYKEIKFSKFYWDKNIFKKVLNFTGWTIVGQISTIARDQGITILLNQVFSPVTVAARAIASNISSKVNLFSSNFNVGLYPSIIKSYASNNKEDMFKLINNGSKLTFYLMWIFAFPLILEMEMILKFWLVDIPEEAIVFSKLSLVESLILSISLPLSTAARAPGKMKLYELSLGLCQLLLFVLVWIFFEMGYPAYTAYVVAISINILMFFVRLKIVSDLIGLNILEYLNSVIFSSIFVILCSVFISYSLKLILPGSEIFNYFAIIYSFIISCISIYFVGLNRDDKIKIKSFLLKNIYK